MQFLYSYDMYGYDHACNALNQSYVLWMTIVHTQKKEGKKKWVVSILPEPVSWGGFFVCLFVVCFFFPGCCLRHLILCDNMCLSWYIHAVSVTMATLQSHKSVLGIKRIFVFESRERCFFSCWYFCTEICCVFFFTLTMYNILLLLQQVCVAEMISSPFFATPRYTVFGILNALVSELAVAFLEPSFQFQWTGPEFTSEQLFFGCCFFPPPKGNRLTLWITSTRTVVLSVVYNFKFCTCL